MRGRRFSLFSGLVLQVFYINLLVCCWVCGSVGFPAVCSCPGFHTGIHINIDIDVDIDFDIGNLLIFILLLILVFRPVGFPAVCLNPLVLQLSVRALWFSSCLFGLFWFSSCLFGLFWFSTVCSGPLVL